MSQSAPPSSRSWTIGAAAGNDVVVDASSVSGRHCRITEHGADYILEDLGSTNGTFVNGERLKAGSPAVVSRTDSVSLGRNVPFPWEAIVGSRSKVAPSRPRGATRLMQEGVITVGRESDNDVVLDYSMVSGHHARIVFGDGGAATIEDLGSTNGTAIGDPQRKIKTAPLSADDVVYFGSLKVPASRLLSGHLSLGAAPSTTLSLRGDSMVLGRDPRADHVLDYPMVSWRHARLTRTSTGIFVEDLGSTNGTFVNGRRITGRVTVEPGDVIGLASFTFQLTAEGNLQKRDYRGNVTIEVQDLGITVGGGKKLVAGVSLTVYPSELVGLMGPSGAGKTTVLKALNGYTAPAAGSVLFNGQDLYTNYDAFRLQLGYVPQDDIMHRELTVGEALYYSARLRLPPDFSDAELRARIRAVTSDLEIQHIEATRIGSAGAGISGGQRKRVALAMELLTDPSVLFLDEPTSGLSSEDALLVMKLLRKLADAGKTIVLVIHQPSLEVFQLMDNLAVVSKDAGSPDAGRLVYYGRAYPDSIAFFNGNAVAAGDDLSPDAVLRGLKTKRTTEWTRAYAASAPFREYVQERRGRTPSPPARPASAAKVKHGRGVGQWWTLVRRNAAVRLKDTANTAILVAQAPVIGVLILLVFGDTLSRAPAAVMPLAEWSDYARVLATTLFLLAATAIWFGCSNAAREIVAEWSIYQRERMVNLGIPSYVLAKLAVLGALSAMQCVVLLGLVYAGGSLKGFLPGMLMVLLLASFVGLGIGLVVSALARSSEVAIATVPLILLPMVILAGSLQPVYKMSGGVRALSALIASRWAFEGLLLREVESRPPSVPDVGLQASAPDSTSSSSRGPDFAEDFFPRDRRRTVWPDRPLVALTLMLGATIIALMGILKSRDVH
jgi:ABC-type multidrug transport system ATPase subunit